MKYLSITNSAELKLLVLSAVMVISAPGSLSSQTIKLKAVSDMIRVFEDGYKLPDGEDTLKISGIRGEIVSGQCMLSTQKGLTKVTVEAAPLINNKTGRSLPEESVKCNFTGSVPLTKNTPNQPVSALYRKAPALFPEYLREEKQINVKEKSYQGIWITVKIPETAEQGNFYGRLTVKSGQTESSLPVRLTVYPLTIPHERHLKIVEWYNTDGFARFHGIKEEYSPEWFAMLKKYAENMAEHRQNTFRVDMDMIEITRSGDGSFRFDFLRFDQIADVFWNTGGMDFMETGFLALRGEKGWGDTNFRWKEFRVKDSESGKEIILPGIDVIPSLVSAFESHLRQKGWLHKTWFHVQDEPAVHNALSWIEFSQFIHRYAPDLVRIDAIETTYLLDEIEIAVPKLDHFSTWYDNYINWQKKGNELWFYTVGIYQGSLFPNKTIDVPLIDTRILHWMNYKYDATGYLHWGWNQWNEDPFQDPGMHIGDGWHVYPASNGVLNSLRWEQMRNGIQDYEYLWMLEQRIRSLRDSLGSRFSWIDPEQRGKEIAGKVVSGFAEHTDDPDVLLNARKCIINEILGLETSPLLYVQTNPHEGSLITSGSTVEVLGWVEAGATIEVNGRELPVSAHGFFAEQFQLTGERNKIIVKAAGPRGSRDITRIFSIK